MVLYTGGPYIPGLPPKKPAAAPKAKPAKPKVTPKRVNTTTLAGVLAASRPKPPSTPRVFIPELATPEQRATLSPSVAAQAPAFQRPTQSSLNTGSIESKSAKTQDGTTYRKPEDGDTAGTIPKPGEVTNEQEKLQAAQNAADALRLFQSNVAQQNLVSALSQIDRAAIDQYKGIANDYAARGMTRSGGKIQAETKAQEDINIVKDQAVQEVFDFITEIAYGGNIEQAKTNLAKSNVFQQWLNTKYGDGTNG